MNKSPTDSRIVICGAARNIEGKIEDVIRVLSASFSSFKEIHILICESFSNDKTVEKLKQMQTYQKNFQFIQDLNIDKNEVRRTVRISSARSELQSAVRLMYDNFDYVAMIDLDGVNRDLTRNSVESIWTFDSWDAAFANQPLRYYDVWALRANDWSEGDCWKEYQELVQTLPARTAKRIAVTNKMRSISEKSQPIMVNSAFGGLGIYKMAAFLDSEYIGADANGLEICEHVYFNETLVEKGYQLFIFPSLVNLNRRSQVLNIIKEMLLRVVGTIK